MRAIVKAAKAIDTLWNTIQNICNDDNKESDDYTDNEYVSEAEYCLSTFFESGHINNDALIGDYGPEGRSAAQRDVRRLKALIKKYKAVDNS